MNREVRYSILFIGLLLLGSVTGVPVSAAEPVQPSDCLVHHYGVYESSENVSDVEDDPHAHYGNLSSAEQRIFDRGLSAEGERIRLGQAEWREIRDVPPIVVSDETVYRTSNGHAYCTTGAKAIYYVTRPVSLSGLAVIALAVGYWAWNRRRQLAE